MPVSAEKKCEADKPLTNKELDLFIHEQYKKFGEVIAKKLNDNTQKKCGAGSQSALSALWWTEKQAFWKFSDFLYSFNTFIGGGCLYRDTYKLEKQLEFFDNKIYKIIYSRCEFDKQLKSIYEDTAKVLRRIQYNEQINQKYDKYYLDSLYSWDSMQCHSEAYAKIKEEACELGEKFSFLETKKNTLKKEETDSERDAKQQKAMVAKITSYLRSNLQIPFLRITPGKSKKTQMKEHIEKEAVHTEDVNAFASQAKKEIFSHDPSEGIKNTEILEKETNFLYSGVQMLSNISNEYSKSYAASITLAKKIQDISSDVEKMNNNPNFENYDILDLKEQIMKTENTYVTNSCTL